MKFLISYVFNYCITVGIGILIAIYLGGILDYSVFITSLYGILLWDYKKLDQKHKKEI